MADLPEKSPHRVVTVGASYLDHTETILPDGSEGVVPVYRVGRFGEIIQLAENQARRLLHLGAVKPADAPLAYHEQDQQALQAQADDRGITVVGSGANGEVIRTDLVSALENHDRATNIQESALAAVEAASPAVPAGAYSSASKDDLQAEADRRGLAVDGSGSGGNVTKDDLVGALEQHDATAPPAPAAPAA